MQEISLDLFCLFNTMTDETSQEKGAGTAVDTTTPMMYENSSGMTALFETSINSGASHEKNRTIHTVGGRE